MGSHHLTDMQIAWVIESRLTSLPDDSTVLLRRPMSGTPRGFEGIVAAFCRVKGISVSWYAPEPGGRQQTFFRDYQMIENADRVEAFFDENHRMEGGTGHVVEACLSKAIPVTAWSIGHYGQIEEIGDFQPEGLAFGQMG